MLISFLSGILVITRTDWTDETRAATPHWRVFCGPFMIAHPFLSRWRPCSIHVILIVPPLTLPPRFWQAQKCNLRPLELMRPLRHKSLANHIFETSPLFCFLRPTFPRGYVNEGRDNASRQLSQSMTLPLARRPHSLGFGLIRLLMLIQKHASNNTQQPPVCWLNPSSSRFQSISFYYIYQHPQAPPSLSPTTLLRASRVDSWLLLLRTHASHKASCSIHHLPCSPLFVSALLYSYLFFSTTTPLQ